MTPEPFVPQRCRFAAAAVLALAPAAMLQAQNSVRCWGSYQFASDAYDLPSRWLAVRNDATVVVRADGRVFVHGYTPLPEPPAPPTGITYVQAGISSSWSAPAGFALRSDGWIVSWTPAGAPGPATPALPANVTYVRLSVGAEHVLALRSDGVAVAWGGNTYGQATLPVIPPGVTVLDVHAGSVWSALLLSNGTIAAFGSNSSGQTAVPALPPAIGYVELWGGNYHAIARRSDGAIVAWGDNDDGQCNVPPAPAGTTYLHFGAGSSHTIAARSDDVLVAWGANWLGQCNVPPLPPGAAVVQIAAADYQSLVRLANGTVLAWGQRHFALPAPRLAPGETWAALADGGTLGLTSFGRIEPLLRPVAVPAPPAGVVYTQISAEWGCYAALRSDGRAVAWGYNSNPQGQAPIPPLPPGMTYTAVVATSQQSVLLRSDGLVVTSSTGAPAIPPPPPGLRYEEIDATGTSTMLRRSDGAVLVVTTGAVTTFPAAPAELHYTAIAHGRQFTAALRSDGQIVTSGATFVTPLPPLPPGVVYVEIDAGDEQLLARRADGEVVCASSQPNDPRVFVPRLAAGESFVDVSASTTSTGARIGPTSTYVIYAAGCAGTLPAARLVPRDTPRLGAFHFVRLFDLPQDAAIMVFGWQRTSPIPLAPLGLPGCSQHVTADAAVLVLGQDHQARYWLGIPNAPALVGQWFHNQAVVFDAGANAAGAVVSDAARGIVGSF